MSFQEYLLSIGYLPFRVIFENGEKKYIPAKDDYFSTAQHGYIDIRYRKLNKEIVFGLHERDKPPTLISPRPRGIESDDDMNIILMNLPHEITMKLL